MRSIGDEDEGVALAGGVSSDIRIVDSPAGRCVVKRALPKLRVAADWFSDPARSSIEARALGRIAELIGQAHVPRVLWVDEARHRFAMELIDARLSSWKQQLMRGDVDLATARAAGRLLGELHRQSTTAPDLPQQFADTGPFDELRIRPYFTRIAKRNPALAPTIAHVVQELRGNACALVHGDYSPKNLLADGAEVVILDCEVAHWGDARFDVAFCVTHLLLKSFRRDAPSVLLVCAALAFLVEYRKHGLDVLDTRFAQQLGCLLLARLEGDSPVDYLGDLDADIVKAFATDLLLDPPENVEACLRELARVPR
jgi:aminoglycoside phosphotransferase (APT) family kinase protein